MDKGKQALQDIHDIAIDYDGYGTIESLKELIDELKSVARQGLNNTKDDGYIHPDDPIIRTVECCDGFTPCFTCKGEGTVTEGMFGVVDEVCPEYNTEHHVCSEMCPDNYATERDDCWQCRLVPITPGNVGEFETSRLQWRKLC